MQENLSTQYPDIPVTRIETKYANGPTVEELQQISIPKEFYSLTGPMQYTMLNDAMFHIVLEANPELLKELLCSLMPLKPTEISSLAVTNPIQFGAALDDKGFILDVKAVLNDDTIINIELQVQSLSFWKERSLEYLCRIYDNVKKGASYLTLKPAVHFGIVDFDTSNSHPEFYSTYHMANDRTHEIYTGKMRLSVLHLNRIDMATKEDTEHNRHFWAEFFKIQTWEELLMLAQTNPVIAEAAKTMYRVSAEEQARNYCEAAERAEKTLVTYEDLLQREHQKTAALTKQLTEKDSQIADLLARVAELEGKNK